MQVDYTLELYLLEEVHDERSGLCERWRLFSRVWVINVVEMRWI